MSVGSEHTRNVSAGSEHTRIVCLNLHPLSMKETDCCHLMLRTSPVTFPYGSSLVTLTSPLGTPGCSIDTLEPVSKIRLLDIPSISTEIAGVPCSNKTQTADFTTALSGALRWKELSSFTPLSRFTDSLYPFLLLFLFLVGLLTGGK